MVAAEVVAVVAPSNCSNWGSSPSQRSIQPAQELGSWGVMGPRGRRHHHQAPAAAITVSPPERGV